MHAGGTPMRLTATPRRLAWLLVATLCLATFGTRVQEYAVGGSAVGAASADVADLGAELGAGSLVQGRYRLVSKLDAWPQAYWSREDGPGYNVTHKVLEERYHNMFHGLGGGSFGETWLAFDSKEWRQVAVKFFMKRDTTTGRALRLKWPPGWGQDDSPLRAAFAECKIAQLMMEKGTEKGRSRLTRCLDNQAMNYEAAHLVLELAGTSNLHQDMKRRREKSTRSMPPDLVLRVAKMLLEALEQLEVTGFVHLDIKPDNIMVYSGFRDKELYLRLVDFGLASHQDTKIKGLRGTLAYMAPEILASANRKRTTRADPRNDVFSAGVVLHELVCGRVPYEGLKQDGVDRAKYAESYAVGWEQLLCDDTKVDPALWELFHVAKTYMLQPDPSKRQHASALLEHPVFQGLDIPPCASREPFMGQDVTDRMKDGDIFRKHGRDADNIGKCCCPQEGACLYVPDKVLLKKCGMRSIMKSTLSCKNCMPTGGMINVEKKASQVDPSELSCWVINPHLDM